MRNADSRVSPTRETLRNSSGNVPALLAAKALHATAIGLSDRVASQASLDHEPASRRGASADLKGSDRELGPVKRRDHLLGVDVKLFALLGRYDAPITSLEKQRAEELFKTSNARGNVGLNCAETSRCAGKSLRLVDCDEVSEVLDVHPRPPRTKSRS